MEFYSIKKKHKQKQFSKLKQVILALPSIYLFFVSKFIHIFII